MNIIEQNSSFVQDARAFLNSLGIGERETLYTRLEGKGFTNLGLLGEVTLDIIGESEFSDVYFTPGILDGRVKENGTTSRKTEHVIGIRALYIDIDKKLKELPVFHLEPTVVVETSPEKYHVYWRLNPSEHWNTDAFKDCQKRLINKYESDRNVCDLSRVMRLPGVPRKTKDGEYFIPHVVRSNPENVYTIAEVMAGLEELPKPKSPTIRFPVPTSEAVLGEFDQAVERAIYGNGSLFKYGLASAVEGRRNHHLIQVGIELGKLIQLVPARKDEVVERIMDWITDNWGAESYDKDHEILVRYQIPKGVAKDLSQDPPRLLSKNELFFHSSPQNGLVYHAGELTRVGNHLIATAYLDSPDGDDAKLQIQYTDSQNNIRYWEMPRSLLTGEGKEVISELHKRGYHIEYRQRTRLMEYLFSLGKGLLNKYTISSTSGWVGGGETFLMPNKTYGDERIRFQGLEPQASNIQHDGTLESWQNEVGNLVAGNSRLIFAVGAALAAPLLKPLGVESGGFHFYGPTSTGKTTLLALAASVVGYQRVERWATTANALEATAEAHNDLLLCLDEIGQSDPRKIGEIAYLLANNQGKQRMNRDAMPKKLRTWRLLFLSSGENKLGNHIEHMEKGGQEARMPDIPIEPSEGNMYGVLDTIHHYESSAQFIVDLQAAIKRNRGVLFDQYILRLVGEPLEKRLNRLYELQKALASQYENDSVVYRVALRFALVQVALELAHEYKLLPWPSTNTEWAVKACFGAWLNDRGGVGSIEAKQMLDNVTLKFFQFHKSDRFIKVPKTGAPESEYEVISSSPLWGFVDENGSERLYLVPVETFKHDFAGSKDIKELLKLMADKGYLIQGKDRCTRTHRVGGKVYRLLTFREYWAGKEDEVKRLQNQDEYDL